jgi:MEMO1 family protein
MMQPTVRPAAVAGSWYPGSAAALAAELDGYLHDVGPLDLQGRLVALVSPHAGLRYSGPVAARGYALLRRHRVGSVVLVGPAHRSDFEGVALFARGSFETPLGRTPIDEDLAQRLLDAGPPVFEAEEPHRHEHSLEMQLPFLQHLVPGLRIVPLLMGSQAREDADALATGLGHALRGRDALLVASSDLSHYHPAPVANRLDAQVVGDVERFDPEGLMARLETAPEHACGGGPMVAVMKAARMLGATRAIVLRYADSGDAGEHDKTRVVGYLSAGFATGGV